MSDEIKTQSEVADATAARGAENEKKSLDDGVFISLGVAILIIIIAFFYMVFSGSRERPASAEVLRQRCDADYGVYVEGMTHTDGEETQFSLCIPERAFECIDVE